MSYSAPPLVVSTQLVSVAALNQIMFGPVTVTSGLFNVTYVSTGLAGAFKAELLQADGVTWSVAGLSGSVAGTNSSDDGSGFIVLAAALIQPMQLRVRCSTVLSAGTCNITVAYR